jgi:hypothetical protein
VTHSQAIAHEKDTPPAAGVDVGVMPFELPPESKKMLANALEREQWLQRVGLLGIVTGVANHDMRAFSAACDRLVGAFRAMRDAGRHEGAGELELELRRRGVLEAELGRQSRQITLLEGRARLAWVTGAGFGALAGLVLARLLSGG